MQVVKLSALPALRVNCNVALARRLHSCTLIHLDTLNGGTYHMFLSVIENSSYSPSLDLIGKATCDYRGWHKWGLPGSPADAPEPLHPTICTAGSLSLVFFSRAFGSR